MTLELHGTHGTCRSHADQIMRMGFLPGGVGRKGSGIYWWVASVCPTNGCDKYSIEIATCYAINRYRNDVKVNDNSSRVILGKISVEQSNYLDMEEQAIVSLFITHVNGCKKYLTNSNLGSEKERAGKVMNAFVRFLEEENKTNIHVVRAKTEVPPGFSLGKTAAESYLGLRQAYCYLVRDKSCIVSCSVLC